ncbi:MarR family winged helix-turn-helix transcriptional regulator [Hyphomonas chukchiensis]|uniref:MarR family winged helix-turn-helix transcriptional regulator n=1 Tax=Hyphomonas chukchiensis TaxID=1280947 RepID=UPI0009E07CF9|nr:MarR family transcriptional regulator [Hyphomonas chukchiensis]
MSLRSEDALIALRKIQRVTEMASKRLAMTAGITPSQLSVLRLLSEAGEVSAGRLAEATQLKHATITSLVDKLEARGFISRRRCDEDRRRVWLRLLPEGQTALQTSPDPLHETFTRNFNQLPDWHQSMLISALETVTSLVNAENMDAAPVLDIGDLDQTPD